MTQLSSKIVYDFTIIGAGLTGLSLAYRLLQHNPMANVHILEKSRGSGGRMATRRIDDRTFDHGAQFIKQCSESQFWLDLWKQSDSTLCFLTDKISGHCGKSGMTRLSKALASELEISLESKVLSLLRENNVWTTSTDQGQESLSRNIILTCPLPQSLELLKTSKINFSEELGLVRYAKAIVLLLELAVTPHELSMYQENVSKEIFSFTSQDLKGTSLKPALTVVMTPEFSELHFEAPEENVQKRAQELIQAHLPNLQIQKAHLKKWRYSHPINCWPESFHSSSEGLFLAGDAFGGPSLIGALRSSEATFKALTKQS